MKTRVAIYNCTMSQEVNDLQVALLTELAEGMSEWRFSASKDVYFDVGVSKSQIEGRPALEKVISKAKNGEYDLIVLKSFNNLLRNTNALFELIDELLEYGVGFTFLDEQLTTFEEMDCLKLRFLAHDEESVRMKAGSGGGILGYEKVHTESGIRYELNREETLLVIKIYGSVLQGASLEDIKLGLEFEGSLNARGEDDWSVDMIRGILSNPIYKGETDMGVVVSPIIEAEAWDLIQKIVS